MSIMLNSRPISDREKGRAASDTSWKNGYRIALNLFWMENY